MQPLFHVCVCGHEFECPVNSNLVVTCPACGANFGSTIAVTTSFHTEEKSLTGDSVCETVDSSRQLDSDLDDSRRVSNWTGRTIGRYRVEQGIGKGGMGAVYSAADTALGQHVALKVLPPGFSSHLRKRLLREAWANAKLQLQAA